MQRKLLPGRPYPLGAKASSKGTNFAVYSEHATQVHVCLFDEAGKETDCIALRERTAFVWHGLVLGIKPGQLYGFRVEGPWEPERGERFNAKKLLVDPYAEAIAGEVDWKAPIFGHQMGDDLKKCDQDDAAGVPKSVVVEHKFDWGNDCLPQTPLADSVIYEVHVKGFLGAQSQRAGEAARDVCGAGAPGEHRLSEGAGRDGGGADADPRDGG